MCRLLGYSSQTLTTFGEVVGENFNQFVKLADDHCDGWGIATSQGKRADLYKEALGEQAVEVGVRGAQGERPPFRVGLGAQGAGHRREAGAAGLNPTDGAGQAQGAGGAAVCLTEIVTLRT